MNDLTLFSVAFLSNLIVFLIVKTLFRIIKPNILPKLFFTDLIISSLYYSIIPFYIVYEMENLFPRESPRYILHLLYIIPALYNVLKYYFLMKKYPKMKIKKINLFIEFLLLAWLSASIAQFIAGIMMGTN